MDFYYHQQQQWIERGVSLGRQLKRLWANLRTLGRRLRAAYNAMGLRRSVP